ncbi:TetR/AcrR family transcriptional regulator [Nocardioides exalbidus]|uniref:TetR/AcrR family transcriptional regulator n=1 Tax=Nocardioides exalbidus TaxID=402596 RepID=UPI000A9B1F45|nr:helix-turn-helix domain-containing protein [Nocardioides exalbidus]
MLNSVTDGAAGPGTAPVRRRLSAQERRRQLVGIGLSKIVEKPIQDLSMDDIAAEAGISRGLLFHYFPTKTDFYLACIAAAGRRMLRTTAPDEDLPGRRRSRW